MVLVDTSIWSLALRRANAGQSYEVRELHQLISDSRVVLIGPIRQELLSGIRYQNHYDQFEAWLVAAGF